MLRPSLTFMLCASHNRGRSRWLTQSAMGLAMLVGPWAFSLSASASQLVTQPSKYSVSETIDRLSSVLEAKGIKPIARIDHSSAARAAGQELRPTTVLLFGNPKLGTPLMRANPAAAIDLPMRVVAFEDASGHVMVGYTAPTTLKSRHSLSGVDAELDAMTKALEAFVAAATN